MILQQIYSENHYQISPKSPEFCRRYYKKYCVFFRITQLSVVVRRICVRLRWLQWNILISSCSDLIFLR